MRRSYWWPLSPRRPRSPSSFSSSISSSWNSSFSGAYEPLPWAMRITIAIGVAKALSLLHERHVVHLDVKASSILLDSEFNAKLSSFYFAMPSSTYYESHIADEVLGTYGYIAGGPHLPWPVRINIAMSAVNKYHERYYVHPDAEALDILLDSGCSMTKSGVLRNLNNRYAAPEYPMTDRKYPLIDRTDSASPKWDVYSFGVVLLELLTGRVFDANESPKRFLKDRLIDVKLEGQCSEKMATAMADLALRCLDASPECRPCMSVVLATLERLEGSRTPQNFNMSITGKFGLPYLKLVK